VTSRFELTDAALREEAAAWLHSIGYMVIPAYDWSPTSLVVLSTAADVEEVALVVRRVDPNARRAD
jgi:hypothetical protein